MQSRLGEHAFIQTKKQSKHRVIALHNPQPHKTYVLLHLLRKAHNLGQLQFQYWWNIMITDV